MTVRKDGAQTSYPLYEELPDCLKLKDRPAKRSKTSLKPIITFVTGNKKKLEEVKQILSSSDGEAAFELTNVKLDLPGESFFSIFNTTDTFFSIRILTSHFHSFSLCQNCKEIQLKLRQKNVAWLRRK